MSFSKTFPILTEGVLHTKCKRTAGSELSYISRFTIMERPFCLSSQASLGSTVCNKRGRFRVKFKTFKLSSCRGQLAPFRRVTLRAFHEGLQIVTNCKTYSFHCLISLIKTLFSIVVAPKGDFGFAKVLVYKPDPFYLFSVQFCEKIVRLIGK